MDCLFLPADSPARLDAETRVYWLPKEEPGRWQPLGECAAGNGAISLILPAEVCSFFAVTLPTRKARWMQQALAYAEVLDIPFVYSSNGDAFLEHDLTTSTTPATG